MAPPPLFHGKTILTVGQKYESKGTFKNPDFQTFWRIRKNLAVQPRLFKNPNLPLLWIEKILEVWTAQDQHFKIQILASLLKIRWAIYIKKDGHILNFNINDWDIQFAKSLKFFQWIGKNIFHWVKWNEPIGNSAHTIVLLFMFTIIFLLSQDFVKSLLIISNFLKIDKV